MFGEMVKEANQREDVKAYVVFRDVFAKFHTSVKKVVETQQSKVLNILEPAGIEKLISPS